MKSGNNRNSGFTRSGRRSQSGFTLTELLVSMAILAFLMLMLVSVTDSASRAWRDGEKRIETYQSARTALEIVGRELAPAVVDTRMQFVIAPGSILTNAGAQNLAPESPTVLWMAPVGNGGSLSCVGYYLFRDARAQFYRLKRIYIPAKTADGQVSPYFPKIANLSNPQDTAFRTSPVNANWFTNQWDASAFDEEDPTNTAAVVSSAADGVVAFWVQAIDILGNPAPLVSQSQIHPASELMFNSAAYFQVATSAPFDNGCGLIYLAQTAQSMRANRLPAAVDLTVVTLDNAILERGVDVPTQANVLDANGAIDVPASVEQFTADLLARHIQGARTFSTRVKLMNGT